MDTKLYTNLVNDIKNKIISGELSPGDRLPSENELLDIYNISKTTISKSMQILANEGYIVTVPRVGNFVSKPTVSKYLFRYNENEILKRISNKTSICNFEISKGNEKYIIAMEYTNLYCKDSMPVCYIESAVYHQEGNDLSEEDIISMEYFDMVKRYHNLHALKKKISIEAVICPQKICELLKLRINDSVLKVTAQYHDSENILVGSRTAYYNSNYADILAEEQ